MFGRKIKAIATWTAAAAASLALAGSLATPASAAPLPKAAPVVAAIATPAVAPQVAPVSLAMSDAKSPYACGWPGMHRIWTHSSGRFRTSIYIRQYNWESKIVCTIVTKTSKTSLHDSIGIKYGKSSKKSYSKSYARTYRVYSGTCLKVEGRRGTTKHRHTVCYG